MTYVLDINRGSLKTHHFLCQMNISNSIKIFSAPRKNWADFSAGIVVECILACIKESGHCDVMLTGGNSAALLYAAWARHPNFRKVAPVSYYFGDERCVPHLHADSNFGLAMRTLFSSGVPDGCSIHRMHADSVDLDRAAGHYAMRLPDCIDVLLLGVGEDGHIASLYPHSAALYDIRRVVPIKGPNLPSQRLTITPTVIQGARYTFVLATGPTKSAVLEKVLSLPHDVDAFPVRMVQNSIWLMDEKTILGDL
jgi:6-phosphogluconolactonase